MKTFSTIVAATALAFAFAAPLPGFAQSLTFRGPIVVMPDHSMSVKSMLGAPIFNEQHEKIGTLENVTVQASAAEPLAILSVGDYLGTGPKMVAVPLSHLHLEGNTAMMMPASKKMLSDLPTYTNGG
jgi:sporulation protein YlmC with PRC-barrel domain